MANPMKKSSSYVLTDEFRSKDMSAALDYRVTKEDLVRIKETAKKSSQLESWTQKKK